MEASTKIQHEKQLQNDHQPLIVSQEAEMINKSLDPGGALILIENASDQRPKHKGESSRVVIVPERWGQEGLLKDWIDGSSFDALLAPKEAVLAREALRAQSPPHFKLGF